MSLKTYMYRCPVHGLFEAHVEYEERDNPQSCPECELEFAEDNLCPRTWEQAGKNFMYNEEGDGTLNGKT